MWQKYEHGDKILHENLNRAGEKGYGGVLIALLFNFDGFLH